MDNDKVTGIAMTIGFIIVVVLTLTAIYFALWPNQPGRHAAAEWREQQINFPITFRGPANRD